MSVFTLAFSCLTTSNLPWLKHITFQVPIHYCSLQQQTLPPSPVTSTTRCCFFFGSVSSFFLELFLHSSPVAYWAPTDLGSSSLNVISFCLFILFMRFSRQEYWSGLPFLFPVDPGITNEGGRGDPSFGSCKSIVNSNAKHVLLYILVGYLHKSRIPGLNTWIFCELLSSFKSWKMMLWKCCTQYASKFGKLSSGHRTGKGQFSFESQRKAMAKNAQTTTQFHSSHMLVK